MLRFQDKDYSTMEGKKFWEATLFVGLNRYFAGGNFKTPRLMLKCAIFHVILSALFEQNGLQMPQLCKTFEELVSDISSVMGEKKKSDVRFFLFFAAAPA